MHPYIVAQQTPDKPAYIMAGSGETVTYRQLDQRSNQGAQLFRSLGLKAGDHIALLMNNNARLFEICWAAQRSGLIYTAVSARLTASEAQYIVNDCGAKLLIAGTSHSEQARELRLNTPQVQNYFSVEGIIDGYEKWELATCLLPTTPMCATRSNPGLCCPKLNQERLKHGSGFQQGRTGVPRGGAPIPARKIA